MKFILVLLTGYAVFVSGCSRNGKCDCVPPPATEANWKLIQITGGLTGMGKPLTEDQQNSILTTTSTGRYTCRHTVSGQISNGMIKNEPYNGSFTKFTFNPLIQIYPVEWYLLTEKTGEKMVLTDINPDGYTLIFSRQP